jgi:asparagine synthase (glutamine-hydrolysing)
VCGIAGMSAPASADVLERMAATFAHRGPDDEGVHVGRDGLAGLACRRLSILDLSRAGHMPMVSADGKVAVAQNGEIYNFRELRRGLERAGHTFRSRSDTEVLLHGYEEWGDGLPDRLNGIFAFAVWDESEQRLFLARDRFGVKPLYYWVSDQGQLFFASEAKALFAAGFEVTGVEPAALHRFLSFLWVPGPATMFPGVRKLEPGHWAAWRDGTLDIQEYWRPRFAPRSMPISDAAAELREILQSAVVRQLVADVPVGILLSGGLDSTALAALATCATGAPVRCYTIAFRRADTRLEQSADDARFASMAARTYGAELNEIEVAPDIVDLLPKVVWQLDEPLADPAAIVTYLISEAARKEVTVLLSGQGADEVFAGYRVQGMPFWAERLALLPPAARRGIAERAVALLPGFKDRVPGVNPGFVLAVHRYLDKMLGGVDLPLEDRYVRYRSYYSDDELRALYSPALRATLADEIAGSEHLDHFADVPDDDLLNRILYVDWKTFLPELNLAYCDKMSMAASIETRVPYLDNQVVDFMLGVPPDLKLHGFTSKYVLREAMKDLVPPAILRRRKAGFGAPIRTWLRRDLREMVDDLLSAGTVSRRGYFDPVAVRRLIDDDREGRADNTYRIWALVTLELWQQIFMEGRAH